MKPMVEIKSEENCLQGDKPLQNCGNCDYAVSKFYILLTVKLDTRVTSGR